MTTIGGVPPTGPGLNLSADQTSPGIACELSPSPKGSTPSDEELMTRVQSGDTDAFAKLYDRHAARALRLAQAICKGTGRAEAALQEGFSKIWHDRAQFDPEVSSFKAWAMSIVRNRAIDSRVHTRSDTAALLASLGELPEAQAEVIALAYIGELTHSEIAAMLDLPSGTVKGRMRLGLEKLRRRMGVPA